MKRIAVACNDKKVIGGFENCKDFELYETEAGQVEKQWMIKNRNYTSKFLPPYLSDIGVKAVICGAMEPSSQEALKKRGVEVFPGMQGDAEDKVEAYMEGNLKPTPVAC